MPFDAEHLALFEKLASHLRGTPLLQSLNVIHTEKSQAHFAVLESYFSDFIEDTGFDINEARVFF
jgi:hypothetical protein